MLVVTAFLVLGDEGGSYFSFGLGPFILMLLYGAYSVVSLVLIAITAFTKKAG